MDNELYHYGVLGMKWGVRRAVKKANKYLNNVEKYQGKANASLQASKGHRILATKAKSSNNKFSEQNHNRKSKQLLSDSEIYERVSQKYMSKFLKQKASAMYNSTKIEKGSKYIESLYGLNIRQDNIDKYEKRYKNNSRYSEGYEAEHQHLKQLQKKYS